MDYFGIFIDLYGFESCCQALKKQSTLTTFYRIRRLYLQNERYIRTKERSSSLLGHLLWIFFGLCQRKRYDCTVRNLLMALSLW